MTGQKQSTVYRVRAGDTVYSILRRHGFNENQVKAALSQSPLPRQHVLSEDAIYRAVMDSKQDRFEVKFYSLEKPKAYVFWRGADKTSAGATVERIDFKTRVVTASGVLRGSLVENIRRAVGGDDLLAYRFMDAFLLDYHNLPRRLQKNAPFSLTYERLYENGEFIRHGEILRAELQVGQELAAREFKRMKKGGIFVNHETDYAQRPFYAPVDYIRFSSLFQPRRFHPIKKYTRSHQGLDFEIHEGAPIYAVSAGRVLRSGFNRAAGNYIVLKHANGYESYYNHLQKPVRHRANQSVRAGEQIGEIGCTGYCTKPHLHFAIKRSGQFVNPIQLIKNYSYGQKEELNSIWSRAEL